MSNNIQFHGTTIIAIRKDNKVAIGGDGQVSMGSTIVKKTANKIRVIKDGKILAGFAGATADALTLFEKLEIKLEKYSGQLTRSCVELAKDWRTDKYLRRLEALLIVVDKDNTFIISGSGDVMEPEDGIAAVGSGGNYALSAAKALIHNSKLSAEEIVKKSLEIASEICVYSNNNLTIKTLN